MIGVDTNLLVYAHRTDVAEQWAARRAIQRASDDPRGWGIALPSVAEFWSVVTPPRCAGGPSMASRLELSCGRWTWTANSSRFAGARIFDLQLALIAIGNGASEIWTHASSFVVFPGLRRCDPLRS